MSVAESSRTPTLDEYARYYVWRPDRKNIRRWIRPNERRIYINIAAPNGKIDRLEFGKEYEHGK